MKRKFSRIFGLTLALVLALSLVFPVAAVAGTNKWTAETIMSYSSTLNVTKTISPNDVVALATDSAGDALYAIVAGVAGIELLTGGNGRAEWSTDQAHSGSYSVLLDAGILGGANAGRVRVEIDAIPMADFTGATFWVWEPTATQHGGSEPNTDQIYPYGDPYINILIDTTGDGTFDEKMEGVGSITVGTPLSPATHPTPSLETWVQMEEGYGFYDMDDGMGSGIGQGPGGSGHPWDFGDLAEWKAWFATNQPTWTVVGVEITFGYWGPDVVPDVFVDDVTINGTTYGLDEPGGTVGAVYKSINGGQTWATVGTTGPSAAVAVAVAPDDPGYVIAADAAGNVFVSTNGGSTWSSDDWSAYFDDINSVDISVPDKVDKRWIAAGGQKGGVAKLYVTKIETFATPADATSSPWTGWVGAESVLAVKFSPMLDYDDTLLALTIDADGTDLQMCDEVGASAPKWNDEPEYSKEVIGEEASAASIALPDGYDGVEPTARIAYIGTDKGAYRMDDVVVKILYGVGYDFRSIAYNSVDNMLLIGSGSSAAVKMSANPDTASPSFTTPRRYKYPSGANVTAVVWLGSTMLCGTNGAESAVSISTNAREWNQLSLIDTDLGGMTDVAVSEDGAVIYLASLKGNNASVWRYASRWERVLCENTSATPLLVRLVPGDPEHVIVGQVGSTEMRVSTDSGDTWKRVRAKVDIVDIAVKDEDIVHVLGTNQKVSTSTDGGFHFATGKKTNLTDVVQIVVAPNGDVLVAGVYAGVVTVAFSTDDAATFSRTAENTGITPDAKPILIAPDKDYATNSAIFVAHNDDLKRWEIGAGDEEWVSRGPDVGSGYYFTGLGYYGGALYATESTGTNSTHASCMNPSATTGRVWDTYTAFAADFGCTPQALKFSSGSTKLWAVDAVGSGTTADKLYSYTDTIGVDVVAPTLLAPADGYEGSVDVVLERINAIRFSWEQVHKDVSYELEIATDEAMKLNVEGYNVATKKEYITIVDGAGGDGSYPFIAGETYYWRVSVRDPIRGPWSEVRSFSIAEAVAVPVEVTVEMPPVEVTVEAPEVTVEAPIVTVPAPVITVEAPAAADITVEVPPAEAPETPGYIWSIIAIGAVLVIAVIILIVRTRRVA